MIQQSLSNKKIEKNIHLNNEFDKPLVISGPCSAESKDQLINTALQLQKVGIKIFRAGIWKPRSRPGNFIGCGTIGLEWLKEVKRITGMLIAVEVATAEHVEETLKNDVDILWVGARTTVNPFAVQELAESLAGIDKLVLVKNPINPDLDLWVGAIERFLKAGVKNIGAIHRGFSLYNNKKYRNEPLWQIPLDFKIQFPDLLMICDPSHICGNTEYLYEVSQKALDLNFDGLMIESHIDPANALSDSKQQVTPEQLQSILNRLKLRKPNVNFLDSIEALRRIIDEKDKELIKILNERMDVVKKIGKIKNENDILILQEERWESILENMITLGEKYNMSTDFIKTLFKSIHQESILQQSLIMNEN